MLELLATIFRKPSYLYIYLSSLGFFRNVSDEKQIRRLFRINTGKSLDLSNPITYNEKIQWLKLHDRKDVYTKMVDKYEVKSYVSSIIGKEYIIPTLGIYNKFEDIDFDSLPNQFVIKCTHDSGGSMIIKDKNNISMNIIKDKMEKCLKKNYYLFCREWPYKNVKPRIIIEKYLGNEESLSVRDYKFFCFDGEPQVLYISDDSHTKNSKIAFFDMNFNQLNIKRKDYNDYDSLPQKPINFDLMKELSRKISRGLIHVRVDFYEIDGKVFFGEITFYTGSGFIPFVDEKWDKYLGNLIKLPSYIEGDLK